MTKRPELIVDPALVEAGLDAGTIRVIDCTVTFETKPVGASTIHSGRDAWLAGHIPGAAYLHMVDDLSDPEGAYPFTIAPQAQIDRVLSEIGISPDDTVVLYGSGTAVAVTRAWWVLSVSGLRDVRIMDGGWQRWVAEGRAVAKGEEKFTPSTFRGSRNQSAIADRETVRQAIAAGDVQIVNALSVAQFQGTGGTHYGRPGRIPNSLSVPATDLLDPLTGDFAPPEQMARQIAGIDPAKPVITYCGGGIAAAATLFALHVAGHDNLQLYDNSLLEWSAVPDLPMDSDGN
ncbi:MAG: sulfurtransferase [Minwuia thermotolerans]|nr:MAG: sulfurtransferase [Minwuia thermotolerans]